DFELKLFPSEHTLLDQHFVRRRLRKGPLKFRLKLALAVGDATARPAERKRRAQNGRKSGHFYGIPALFERMHRSRFWTFEPNALHRRFEERAIFRFLDRFRTRPQHLDTKTREDPFAIQSKCKIQRGLTAERGENGIGTFALDDGRNRAPFERLNVR